jgi:hypothetical protein
MTAEKVREVMKDCEIHIVPTRSMAEGYLALSLIDANASCEEIEVAMNKALEGVHTGLIAKSDKRGTYNGVYVDVGDYIGVLDDDIITCASPDLKECFSSFISKVPDADIFESVLIFADNDEDKALADGMNDGIKANFPSAEIFSCLGGQNIYNYVIAFS